MTTVGPNVKTRVPVSERERFKRVLLGVFRAELIVSDERVDIFRMEGSNLAAEVIADEEALSARQARDLGTWLELLVDDPIRAKERLAEAGIAPFDYVDQQHDYYQLPGGQVVRVGAGS